MPEEREVDLNSPEYAKLVDLADREMRRRAAIISGNQFQPKLVWTLIPVSENELRSLITAEGSSPFIYIASMQLPRTCITWAGAPHWAQYAWLVMVEVKATFAPGQR